MKWRKPRVFSFNHGWLIVGAAVVGWLVADGAHVPIWERIITATLAAGAVALLIMPDPPPPPRMGPGGSAA